MVNTKKWNLIEWDKKTERLRDLIVLRKVSQKYFESCHMRIHSPELNKNAYEVFGYCSCRECQLWEVEKELQETEW
jgi:hypothetical protein